MILDGSISEATDLETPPVGVWTHLAGICDGTNISVWRDGVRRGNRQP